MQIIQGWGICYQYIMGGSRVNKWHNLLPSTIELSTSYRHIEILICVLLRLTSLSGVLTELTLGNTWLEHINHLRWNYHRMFPVNLQILWKHSQIDFNCFRNDLKICMWHVGQGLKSHIMCDICKTWCGCMHLFLQEPLKFKLIVK